MTCYVIYRCPTDDPATLAEEYDQLAELETSPLQARYRRAWAAKLRRTGRDRPLEHDLDGPIFLCTRERYDPKAVCCCSHSASYLCDRPIGNGRTCDAPLCGCCRVAIADGVDFCRTCDALESRGATPLTLGLDPA